MVVLILGFEFVLILWLWLVDDKSDIVVGLVYCGGGWGCCCCFGMVNGFKWGGLGIGGFGCCCSVVVEEEDGVVMMIVVVVGLGDDCLGLGVLGSVIELGCFMLLMVVRVGDGWVVVVCEDCEVVVVVVVVVVDDDDDGFFSFLYFV